MKACRKFKWLLIINRTNHTVIDSETESHKLFKTVDSFMRIKSFRNIQWFDLMPHGIAN